MKRKKGKLLVLRAMKLLGVVANVAIFYGFLASFYYDEIAVMERHSWLVPILFAYGLMFFSLARVYCAFDISMSKVSEVVYSWELTAVISDGIIYILLCFSAMKVLSAVPILAVLAVQLVWNILWAVLSNYLFFRLHKPMKTLVIYSSEKDLAKLHEVKYFNLRFDIQECIAGTGSVDAILRRIGDFEAVFISDAEERIREKVLQYCVDHAVHAFVIPSVEEIILSGARHIKKLSVPVFQVGRAAPTAEYLFCKRAIDIVVSLIGIVLTSPFMLVTALAIKLYDRGPVFYKQVRLTRDGKRFNIIKFRSMCPDAEKDGVARLANDRDDRITPVGKIIRAIRFDELPQLFNILGGSMTIVGPRPERPEIAAQYEKVMPEFSLRLQVKAGLTGYAQIYGKYNTEPDDKLKMDLMYINNMSVLEDFKLMFATIKILFLRESTEGVKDGQTTAASSVMRKIR